VTRPAGEVLPDLAAVLAEAVPGPWTRLRLTVLSAGTRATLTLIADRPTGPALVPEVPLEALVLAAELRDATAVPDRGAWYVGTIELTGDGVFSATYDYDTEPPITPPPAPGTYAEDLARHPRAERHRPAWLRAALAAGS
jgi:hypothetical protein